MNAIRTLLRKKLMLWIGAAIGFLFFLSAILVIYIGTRSDEWWSETVSSQLSKSLGREVDIQGDFHLDFGRIISVEASSVRISNPAWRESPDMLRLGKLLLEFDPFSLFGKTILIPRLELADIELELVENQDGKKNWIFDADSEQLSDSSSVSRPDKGITLPVGIEQLSLQNSRISLQQPGRERPLILQVDAITGSTDANGKAVFDGDGQLNDLPYSLHALIEPGETGFDVRPSKLTVGEYQVTAEGHISVTDQLLAELDVTGAGPDLSLIARLVNTIQLPAWPFQAKGKIAFTNKGITIANASASAGKNDVAVDGSIDYSGSLQLDAKARGPSLQAVLKGLDYDVIPASAPYEVEAKIEIANNQLTVTAKQARLGPANAVAKLNIPDLNSPDFLKVDVGEMKTTDISTTLAMIGLKLKLPRVMTANVTGQIEWDQNAARFSKVRGSIDTTNFNIDGTIGGPPNYYNTRMNIEINGENFEHFLAFPAEKAIPFQFNGVVSRDKQYTRFEKVQLKVADIQASVLGQVGNWKNLEDTNLDISVHAPNTNTLATILNRKLPEGAVKVDGHVVAENNTFHIDNMNIQLGRNNLEGDMKLVQGKPPLLKGQVKSSYLDLAMLQKQTDEMDLNSKKTDIKNNRSEMVFPDLPIKLDALDKIDMDLDIQAGEVTNSLNASGTLYDISANIIIKDRGFTVSNFQGRGERGGIFNGNLLINQEAENTHLDVSFSGKNIQIGLGAAPDQDPATYPPIEINAQIKGSGNTYHELAVSLTGRIQATQGRGLISNNDALDFFTDTLGELFEAVNPFAKTEKTTGLNCAVYIANLGDGKAEIQDVVIQTDKLTIVSAGIVDLKTEKYNINFQTRPRTGLGISASTITNPYIRLGGSLRKPTVELNPQSAAFTTGAAVATGGLWFIYKGIWDRYFSSRDPCGEALKRDADLQAEKVKKQ